MELYFCSLHMSMVCAGTIKWTSLGDFFNNPVFWGVKPCRWARSSIRSGRLLLPSPPGLPPNSSHPTKTQFVLILNLNPNMTILKSCEISSATRQKTRRHVPHDLNPQQHRYDNLKSHKGCFISSTFLRWHALVQRSWAVSVR